MYVGFKQLIWTFHQKVTETICSNGIYAHYVFYSNSYVGMQFFPHKKEKTNGTYVRTYL